jgi:hypothetical protein
MQKWLENHVLKLTSSDHWPSASPDLNPLNYKLWLVLKCMVCTTRHHNLELLKQALVEAVDHFPIDVIRTAISAQPNIRSNGDHFE